MIVSFDSFSAFLLNILKKNGLRSQPCMKNYFAMQDIDECDGEMSYKDDVCQVEYFTANIWDVLYFSPVCKI